MKKILLGSIVVATSLGCAIGYFNSSTERTLNALALCNVEALSRSEIGDACGGCSTSYNGNECCTITIKGSSYTLYYPRKY